MGVLAGVALIILFVLLSRRSTNGRKRYNRGGDSSGFYTGEIPYDSGHRHSDSDSHWGDSGCHDSGSSYDSGCSSDSGGGDGGGGGGD